MKILVTGKNGFLARELQSLFKDSDHSTTFAGRQDLDLLDQGAVDSFLSDNTFDAVLHTSILGGRRIKKDSSKDYYDNMLMSLNLMKHIDKFKMFLNFDSGASFDRSIGIDNCKEVELLRSVPTDYYGISKVTTSLIGRSFSNFINLRIFNCFGIEETEERFIKRNINRYINKDPIEIFEEKAMDFFYVKDLFKVLLYLLDTPTDYKDINLCYDKKYSMSDISTIINNLSDYKVPVRIGNSAYNYTGDATRLSSLGIQFNGLESGIKDMYTCLKN